jgi:hypothetical protein
MISAPDVEQRLLFAAILQQALVHVLKRRGWQKKGFPDSHFHLFIPLLLSLIGARRPRVCRLKIIHAG